MDKNDRLMATAEEVLQAFRRYLVERAANAPLLRTFLDNADWHLMPRPLAAHRLPVLDYLAGAETPTPIDAAAAAERTLLSALADSAGSLHWAQTYSSGDFGEEFLARYGWVELFGTRGHFVSDVIAGGFLMLGPDVVYPDHHHVAEEIYIPLTDGSFWSQDGGAFAARAAGEIIHHASNIRHAMQTNAQPLVALYLWRGGPLAQKSIISGRDR